MPPQKAYIDRIDNLNMVERLGVIRSLNRKVRVVWPGGDAALIPKDYKVLNRALEAVGVPAMFATLDEPKANALVLVERGVDVVMNDPGCVDAYLKYEHILDGPYQRLFRLPQELGVVLYGKTRTSIVQKPTNFFRVRGVAPDAGLNFSPTTAVLGTCTITFASRGNELGVGTLTATSGNTLEWTQPGETIPGPAIGFPVGTSSQDVPARLDANAYLTVAGTPAFTPGSQAVTVTASLPVDTRQQIETAHTFVIKDNDVSGLKILPNLPNTVIQGGEIQVPFPQSNYRLEGYAFLDSDTLPQSKALALIACVNDVPLMGGSPLTWLCSEVQWEVLDPAQYLYRFGLEFQHDPDGWNPDVVFHDQRTGRPPADLERAIFEDSFGVLRLAANPLTNPTKNPAGVTQPAGYWKVPYLRRVDFESLIGGELR